MYLICLFDSLAQALVSNWNHMKAESNTKVAKAETFQSAEFERYVLKQSLRWLELIEDWVEFGTEVHFVFYEGSATNIAYRLPQ